MQKTTLCYIENDNKILMLYRNKKENDPNEGKWVGIGGKFEENELPLECVKREVFEETGIKNVTFKYVGLVHFISDLYENEDMYLFKGMTTQYDFSKCEEGQLKWVPIEDVLSLPMWEGDKYFLQKMFSGEENFEMSLVYKGESLLEVK